ncbi:MAG: exodeoxyribonuclease VII small subunit [Nitrospirae bacterium]|nr:exodeoxyribonuclease VII small subunit [Nitrospirota bacterium]
MKFEDAFKRLEEVVGKMEKGDMSLDASLKSFEEGIKLSRFLTSRLEEAEGRVMLLLKDEKGVLSETPFDAEPEMESSEDSGT